MSFGRAFPTGEESTASLVDVEEQIRSWLADPNCLLEDEASSQAPVVPSEQTDGVDGASRALGIDISSLSNEGYDLMHSLLLYGCRCPSRIGKVPFEVLLMKPALLKPACSCFRGMKVPDNESRRVLRSYQLVCEKPTPPADTDGQEDSDEQDEADEQEEADVPVQPLVPAEAPAPLSEEANENNAASSGATGEPSEEHNLDSSASRPLQDSDNNYSCHRNCGNADAWENMVGCDTEHAPNGRWFHLTCAGLTAVPEEEVKWYCEDCTNKDSNEHGKDVDHTDDDYSPPRQDKRASEGHNNSSEGGKRKREPEPKGHQRQSEPEGKRQKLEPMPKQGSAVSKSQATVGASPGASGLLMPTFPAAGLHQYAAGIDPANHFTSKYPEELAQTIYPVFREVCAIEEFAHSDAKFLETSRLLSARHNLNLTGGCVKNWWQRHGRTLFGFDERRNPNPDKMVTGVQRPEDRKRAREAAKARTSGNED